MIPQIEIAPLSDFRPRPGRIAAPALFLLIVAVATLCLSPGSGGGLVALPPLVFLLVALVVASAAASAVVPRLAAAAPRRPTGRSPPSPPIGPE